MRPQAQVDAEEKANKKLIKDRQTTCKNAKFYLKNVKQDFENQNFVYKVRNTGCKNPRRNGSAYCQECSDKHSAK